MPGGRCLPSLRPAGPDVPIIGGNINIRHAHLDQIQETEDNRRKLKTKKEHRNRLKTIITWLKKEYPEYVAAGGVVPISQENIDRPNFFQHNNTEDLNYSGINVAVIKAFLGATKRKKSGQLCSRSHLRKFHDAIIFGAEQVGGDVVLSPVYHQEMEKFLLSYKKETVIARRNGEMDENDADPIPFPLYQLICQWAVTGCNLFAWTFTVCQWNCMARSASIDPLGIHNLSTGTDSFKITYDDSKADGAGERVSPKNLYANPFDPYISCPVMALGIWLSTRNETFKAGHDPIFLENGKLGSACHRYNLQLVALLADHHAEVIQYCRIERAKSHGTRKGSATHSTSGTTLPPPLPSIAQRGEWSQGLIFDIYLLFAEPGDQYLGRILAGLSPNSVDFAVLPPHFPQGMTHPLIAEAMGICFGNIIELYANENGGGGGGLVGVLLLFLGSLVYHMDTFIRPFVESNPRHPFSAIPLLQYPDLLCELQAMVTVDATPNIPYATGIPPHIEQLKTMNVVLEKVTKLTDTMVNMTDDIKEAITEAIEARDVQGGIVTVSFLRNELLKHHQQLETILKEQLATGSRNQPQALSAPAGVHAQQNDADGNAYPSHCYDGRFWQVPKNWQFPEKTFRKAGWGLWLNGIPGIVRPFRRLDARFMSPDKKVRDQLKLAWQPIFQMMEQAPGLNIPRSATVTPAFIEESYSIATAYLHTRVGYVWERSTRPEVLTVSSWSKHVQRSSIAKYGNDVDRANLPPARHCNAPHSTSRQHRKRLSREQHEEGSRQVRCRLLGAE